MELELALKITHTRDDITTTADLRITKDPFGPIFLSRETSKMFILIAHLKDFRRENIHIEISKDGKRIEIRGTKPVQEMQLKGWILCKKEVDIRAFRKVFGIPDVVDLDRIKAKYNEDESTLKITMPKKVRGIFGFEIVEEQEEEPKKEENADDDKEETEETKTDSAEEIIDQKEFEERKEHLGRDGLDEEENHEKMVLEEPLETAIKEEPGEVDYLEKEPEETVGEESSRRETLGETVEETEQTLEEQQEIPGEKPAEQPAAPTKYQASESVEFKLVEEIEPVERDTEKARGKYPPDEIQEVLEPEKEAEIDGVDEEVTKPLELPAPTHAELLESCQVEEKIPKEPEKPKQPEPEKDLGKEPEETLVETMEQTEQILEEPQEIPEEKTAEHPATPTKYPETEAVEPKLVDEIEPVERHTEQQQMVELPSVELETAGGKYRPDDIQEFPEPEEETKIDGDHEEVTKPLELPAPTHEGEVESPQVEEKIPEEPEKPKQPELVEDLEKEPEELLVETMEKTKQMLGEPQEIAEEKAAEHPATPTKYPETEAVEPKLEEIEPVERDTEKARGKYPPDEIQEVLEPEEEAEIDGVDEEVTKPLELPAPTHAELLESCQVEEKIPKEPEKPKQPEPEKDLGKEPEETLVETMEQTEQILDEPQETPEKKTAEHHATPTKYPETEAVEPKLVDKIEPVERHTEQQQMVELPSVELETAGGKYRPDDIQEFPEPEEETKIDGDHEEVTKPLELPAPTHEDEVESPQVEEKIPEEPEKPKQPELVEDLEKEPEELLVETMEKTKQMLGEPQEIAEEKAAEHPATPTKYPETEAVEPKLVEKIEPVERDTEKARGKYPPDKIQEVVEPEEEAEIDGVDEEVTKPLELPAPTHAEPLESCQVEEKIPKEPEKPKQLEPEKDLRKEPEETLVETMEQTEQILEEPQEISEEKTAEHPATPTKHPETEAVEPKLEDEIEPVERHTEQEQMVELPSVELETAGVKYRPDDIQEFPEPEEETKIDGDHEEVTKPLELPAPTHEDEVESPQVEEKIPEEPEKPKQPELVEDLEKEPEELLVETMEKTKQMLGEPQEIAEEKAAEHPATPTKYPETEAVEPKLMEEIEPVERDTEKARGKYPPDEIQEVLEPEKEAEIDRVDEEVTKPLELPAPTHAELLESCQVEEKIPKEPEKPKQPEPEKDLGKEPEETLEETMEQTEQILDEPKEIPEEKTAEHPATPTKYPETEAVEPKLVDKIEPVERHTEQQQMVELPSVELETAGGKYCPGDIQEFPEPEEETKIDGDHEEVTKPLELPAPTHEDEVEIPQVEEKIPEEPEKPKQPELVDDLETEPEELLVETMEKTKQMLGEPQEIAEEKAAEHPATPTKFPETEAVEPKLMEEIEPVERDTDKARGKYPPDEIQEVLEPEEEVEIDGVDEEVTKPLELPAPTHAEPLESCQVEEKIPKEPEKPKQPEPEKDLGKEPEETLVETMEQTEQILEEPQETPEEKTAEHPATPTKYPETEAVEPKLVDDIEPVERHTEQRQMVELPSVELETSGVKYRPDDIQEFPEPKEETKIDGDHEEATKPLELLAPTHEDEAESPQVEEKIPEEPEKPKQPEPEKDLGKEPEETLVETMEQTEQILEEPQEIPEEKTAEHPATPTKYPETEAVEPKLVDEIEPVERHTEQQQMVELPSVELETAGGKYRPDDIQEFPEPEEETKIDGDHEEVTKPLELPAPTHEDEVESPQVEEKIPEEPEKPKQPELVEDLEKEPEELLVETMEKTKQMLGEPQEIAEEKAAEHPATPTKYPETEAVEPKLMEEIEPVERDTEKARGKYPPDEIQEVLEPEEEAEIDGVDEEVTKPLELPAPTHAEPLESCQVEEKIPKEPEKPKQPEPEKDLGKEPEETLVETMEQTEQILEEPQETPEEKTAEHHATPTKYPETEAVEPKLVDDIEPVERHTEQQQMVELPSVELETSGVKYRPDDIQEFPEPEEETKIDGDHEDVTKPLELLAPTHEDEAESFQVEEKIPKEPEKPKQPEPEKDLGKEPEETLVETMEQTEQILEEPQEIAEEKTAEHPAIPTKYPETEAVEPKLVDEIEPVERHTELQQMVELPSVELETAGVKYRPDDIQEFPEPEEETKIDGAHEEVTKPLELPAPTHEDEVESPQVEEKIPEEPEKPKQPELVEDLGKEPEELLVETMEKTKQMLREPQEIAEEKAAEHPATPTKYPETEAVEPKLVEKIEPVERDTEKARGKYPPDKIQEVVEPEEEAEIDGVDEEVTKPLELPAPTHAEPLESCQVEEKIPKEPEKPKQLEPEKDLRKEPEETLVETMEQTEQILEEPQEISEEKTAEHPATPTKHPETEAVEPKLEDEIEPVERHTEQEQMVELPSVELETAGVKYRPDDIQEFPELEEETKIDGAHEEVTKPFELPAPTHEDEVESPQVEEKIPEEPEKPKEPEEPLVETMEKTEQMLEEPQEIAEEKATEHPVTPTKYPETETVEPKLVEEIQPVERDTRQQKMVELPSVELETAGGKYPSDEIQEVSEPEEEAELDGADDDVTKPMELPAHEEAETDGADDEVTKPLELPATTQAGEVESPKVEEQIPEEPEKPKQPEPEEHFGKEPEETLLENMEETEYILEEPQEIPEEKAAEHPATPRKYPETKAVKPKLVQESEPVRRDTEQPQMVELPSVELETAGGKYSPDEIQEVPEPEEEAETDGADEEVTKPLELPAPTQAEEPEKPMEPEPGKDLQKETEETLAETTVETKQILEDAQEKPQEKAAKLPATPTKYPKTKVVEPKLMEETEPVERDTEQLLMVELPLVELETTGGKFPPDEIQEVPEPKQEAKTDGADDLVTRPLELPAPTQAEEVESPQVEEQIPAELQKPKKPEPVVEHEKEPEETLVATMEETKQILEEPQELPKEMAAELPATITKYPKIEAAEPKLVDETEHVDRDIEQLQMVELPSVELERASGKYRPDEIQEVPELEEEEETDGADEEVNKPLELLAPTQAEEVESPQVEETIPEEPEKPKQPEPEETLVETMEEREQILEEPQEMPEEKAAKLPVTTTKYPKTEAVEPMLVEETEAVERGTKQQQMVKLPSVELDTAGGKYPPDEIQEAPELGEEEETDGVDEEVTKPLELPAPSHAEDVESPQVEEKIPDEPEKQKQPAPEEGLVKESEETLVETMEETEQILEEPQEILKEKTAEHPATPTKYPETEAVEPKLVEEIEPVERDNEQQQMVELPSVELETAGGKYPPDNIQEFPEPEEEAEIDGANEEVTKPLELPAPTDAEEVKSPQMEEKIPEEPGKLNLPELVEDLEKEPKEPLVETMEKTEHILEKPKEIAEEKAAEHPATPTKYPETGAVEPKLVEEIQPVERDTRQQKMVELPSVERETAGGKYPPHEIQEVPAPDEEAETNGADDDVTKPLELPAPTQAEEVESLKVEERIQEELEKPKRPEPEEDVEKEPEETLVETMEETKQIPDEAQEYPETEAVKPKLVEEIEPLVRDTEQSEMVGLPSVELETAGGKCPPDEIQEAPEPEEEEVTDGADKEVTKLLELPAPTQTREVESSQVEEQIPEEPEKPKQPEPVEEPEQTDSAPPNITDESEKPEVNQKEEFEEREDEMKEENELDMPEELEKLEVPIEEPAPKMKKRKKLCVPCMFAGSAFLVSVIIIAFHLIRTKKRSKRY